MSSSRKRKHRIEPHPGQNSSNSISSEGRLDPDSVLYIQAYEADIIRGPHAKTAAFSLEISEIGSSTSKASSQKSGGALIKWDDCQLVSQPAFPGDEDGIESLEIVKKADNKEGIWVDRYDARLLLDTLPPVKVPGTSQIGPESPGGWSDLPSDNEDTFFFSPEEAEDFRRDKKRRHIDQIREERLKARLAEDGETVDEELWGGSDEEPDEAQRELMRRTAAHLMSSPNPAQLEMRILANHGRDVRFAFLRGRWSRSWHILKGKARVEKQGQEKKNVAALGALAGYGDSDGSDNDEHDSGEVVTVTPPLSPVATKSENHGSPVQESDDAAKEARRARAKEWAEKRRDLKGT